MTTDGRIPPPGIVDGPDVLRGATMTERKPPGVSFEAASRAGTEA